MVLPVVSPSAGPGVGLSAWAHAPSAAGGVAQPDLGLAAVTALDASPKMRADPWPAPPRDPAPLKGLGIPPLNTRQVGDFDRLDDPVPAIARYDAPPDTTGPAQFDHRR
jgi:hypothetical protein